MRRLLATCKSPSGRKEDNFEASVEFKCSYFRATLLLAQSPSQKTNQQRLESFLSASPSPFTSLDDSNHSDLFKENDDGTNCQSLQAGRTNNPRDLASRIKILELYTLHILPRNEEWDYAREFISLSDVLDEETREEFLQYLASLQDDIAIDTHDQERSLQQKPDQELEQKHHHHHYQSQLEKHTDETPSPQKNSQATPSSLSRDHGHHQYHHNHNDSHSHHHHHEQTPNTEKDYGIDSPKSLPPRRIPSPSPPISTSKKPPSSSTFGISSPSSYIKQTLTLLTAIQNAIIHSLSSSKTIKFLSSNPLALLRFVLFLLGLILALSRPGVRDRLRRGMKEGWEKLRRTVGMGVKVSYL